LHMGRQSLIYGIASAATCAPPGCWSQPSLACASAVPDRRHWEWCDVRGDRGLTSERPTPRTGSRQAVTTGVLEEKTG
jgi:hypothetical protein